MRCVWQSGLVLGPLINALALPPVASGVKPVPVALIEVVDWDVQGSQSETWTPKDHSDEAPVVSTSPEASQDVDYEHHQLYLQDLIEEVELFKHQMRELDWQIKDKQRTIRELSQSRFDSTVSGCDNLVCVGKALAHKAKNLAHLVAGEKLHDHPGFADGSKHHGNHSRPHPPPHSGPGHHRRPHLPFCRFPPLPPGRHPHDPPPHGPPPHGPPHHGPETPPLQDDHRQEIPPTGSESLSATITSSDGSPLTIDNGRNPYSNEHDHFDRVGPFDDHHYPYDRPPVFGLLHVFMIVAIFSAVACVFYKRCCCVKLHKEHDLSRRQRRQKKRQQREHEKVERHLARKQQWRSWALGIIENISEQARTSADEEGEYEKQAVLEEVAHCEAYRGVDVDGRQYICAADAASAMAADHAEDNRTLIVQRASFETALPDYESRSQAGDLPYYEDDEAVLESLVGDGCRPGYVPYSPSDVSTHGNVREIIGDMKN